MRGRETDVIGIGGRLIVLVHTDKLAVRGLGGERGGVGEKYPVGGGEGGIYNAGEIASGPVSPSPSPQ